MKVFLIVCACLGFATALPETCPTVDTTPKDCGPSGMECPGGFYSDGCQRNNICVGVLGNYIILTLRYLIDAISHHEGFSIIGR